MTSTALQENLNPQDSTTQTPKGFRPTGPHILIRVIPRSDLEGSIVIPDSAKKKTEQSADGKKITNYVEAEVVALGSGKRGHDETLLQDLASALRALRSVLENGGILPKEDDLDALLARAENPDPRIPFDVAVGQTILFHPAIQQFDRDIDLSYLVHIYGPGEYHIIREDTSVLAVIERDQGLGSSVETGSEMAVRGEY